VGAFDLDLEVGEDEPDEEEVRSHHKGHEGPQYIVGHPSGCDFPSFIVMLSITSLALTGAALGRIPARRLW